MGTYHEQVLEALLAQCVSAYNHASDKHLTQFERDAWDETIKVIDGAMGRVESELPDYEERLNRLIECSLTPLGVWAAERYKRELQESNQQ